MIVRVEMSTISGCTVCRHCGHNVCCNVGFGTLVGVSVFSVMWFELLMTYLC